MKINIEKFKFFDFDKFRNIVIQHFKDNMEYLDLTDKMVVGNSRELPSSGLVVDIYLVDGELPQDENHYDNIQMNFCIDIILLGQSKANSSDTYSELMKKTLKLALIKDKLIRVLRNENFNCKIYLDIRANGFKAVRDVFKTSDNIHNACSIYGFFNAFEKQA